MSDAEPILWRPLQWGNVLGTWGDRNMVRLKVRVALSSGGRIVHGYCKYKNCIFLFDSLLLIFLFPTALPMPQYVPIAVITLLTLCVIVDSLSLIISL